MEEVALEAVAREELAQEAAQDIRVGAGMEATSHYVPTAEKNEKYKPDNCFSLPANAGKKARNFIDGKFVYEKKVE
jgi:hypothetical protein